MKKIFTYLFLLGLPTFGFCQAFTPGNLVVVKVGSGAASLTNKSAQVALLEVTPTGTIVQTIQLPYTTAMATGGNNRFVAQGSSSNDANMSLSANGAYFVMAGYNADTGIASISGVAGTQRTLARIAMDGTFNTSTLMDTAKSKGNARCAASNDGTGFWQVGSSGGVKYVPFGCTGVAPDTATVVSTTVTNMRSIQTFGGDLIVGGGSGTIARVGKITGFPKTTSNTIVNLAGMIVTPTANSIYMTSLPGGPAGLNTMYVADDATPSGIKKFSLNGSGNWDSTGIIDAGSTYRGMTGITSGSTVALSAVKSSSPLNGFVDVSGYGVAPTATPTLILAAPTNTAFRGVGLVPVSLPIQLLSFNAAKTDDGKAKIWWVISNENNVSNYLVERSLNGKDFLQIALLKANGASNYEFNDSKLLDATTYYRVKFVDNSGSFKYSNVVAVTPKKSIKLEIFPNPATETVFVSYPKTNVVGNIRLTSVEGKTLLNQNVSVGSTQSSLDVANLPSGTYVVILTDAEGNQSTKTVIKK